MHGGVFFYLHTDILIFLDSGSLDEDGGEAKSWSN